MSDGMGKTMRPSTKDVHRYLPILRDCHHQAASKSYCLVLKAVVMVEINILAAQYNTDCKLQMKRAFTTGGRCGIQIISNFFDELMFIAVYMERFITE